MGDLVGVRLDLGEEFEALELGDDGLAGHAAVHAFEGAQERGFGEAGEVGDGVLDLRQNDLGLAVEDGGHWQVVALADGKVVEIMGGGDLDGAGALFRVGILVGDDGDAAADDGQDGEFADEVLVALILGVNGHRGVAEHGFGARCRDGDEAAGLVGDRVGDVPEVAADFVVFDFEVGNGGLELGVPVHQAAVAVDQALLVEGDEDFADGRGEAVVHGEAFARPVERGAEAA